MNRGWTIAVVVSVAAHVAFYLGPWSVSRSVSTSEPPLLQIELTPPRQPQPQPAEPEPPEPDPPPPEPDPPPPEKKRPPAPAETPTSEPPKVTPTSEPSETAPPDPSTQSAPVPASPQRSEPVDPARPVAPTRAEPVTPPPSPTPGMSKADFVAYAKGMRSRMLAHRRYPPAALRNGLEGVIKVKVSVNRRGQLVGKPTIARSSGHPVLDDEALRMVQVAAPFDPLPDDADKDVMVFVVPIDFKLQ